MKFDIPLPAGADGKSVRPRLPGRGGALTWRRARLGNLLFLAVAFALGACRPRPEESSVSFPTNVVATVAGRPIQRQALEQELARRGPGVTPESVLGELIRFEATLAQAKASGFHRTPEMVAAVERMLVARFEERELAAVETPAVTEAEVGERYAAEPERHTIPAAARAGVLFLKCSPKASPEIRKTLAQRAEQLRTEVLVADAITFDRLVRENSEDQATRYQRGDTGWLNLEPGGSGWEAPVVAAIFALQRVGECAPVVETPRGFYVLKLTEIRPAGRRPLPEVSELIRHQLQLEKRAQLTAAFQSRMYQGLEIRTNWTAFDQVPHPVRDARRPPSFP